MENGSAYDLFVSYATHNKEIAEYVVQKIEARGARCFIAPRDLRSGREYASEIIRGIECSLAVLLIFSSDSDRSAYVLREINSAVSRNKTIIPLRIENFLPSGAMEFYLGPTHWMDAFPEVLDVHLDQIFAIVNGLRVRGVSQEAPAAVRVRGPEAMDIPDAMSRAGLTYRQITMRAIELDFMIVSPGRSDEEAVAQTYEAWKGISDYSEAGGVLIENDAMIGYCDFYPLGEADYAALMAGEALVQLDMIELYELGGTFCGYIAMMAVEPALASQERFLQLFDWLIGRVRRWAARGIRFEKLGAEAYAPLLEKFLRRFGFRPVGTNPDGGRLYETAMSELIENAAFRQRYAEAAAELAPAART